MTGICNTNDDNDNAYIHNVVRYNNNNNNNIVFVIKNEGLINMMDLFRSTLLQSRWSSVLSFITLYYYNIFNDFTIHWIQRSQTSNQCILNNKFNLINY